MSLKKCMILLLILALMLSVLPMAAAAQAEDAEATAPVEESAEKKFDIPWAYTAAFLALIVTFLQNKFIHGRR